MMSSQPAVNQRLKLFRLGDKLLRFGFRGRIGKVVIDMVALLPAGIEVGYEEADFLSHGKIEGFKGSLVMANSNDAVSFATQNYFGELQDRVIRRREPAIRGEFRNTRILQVSFNDGAQVVKLSTAGLMRLHAPGVQ
jgi:hypothetical protein